MQRIIQIGTPSRNGLFDITREVEAIVDGRGIKSGLVNVYAQRATKIQLKTVREKNYELRSE